MGFSFSFFLFFASNFCVESVYFVLAVSLKPELFEGMRFDFTKGLNQRFSLSHRQLCLSLFVWVQYSVVPKLLAQERFQSQNFKLVTFSLQQTLSDCSSLETKKFVRTKSDCFKFRGLKSIVLNFRYQQCILAFVSLVFNFLCLFFIAVDFDSNYLLFTIGQRVHGTNGNSFTIF